MTLLSLFSATTEQALQSKHTHTAICASCCEKRLSLHLCARQAMPLQATENQPCAQLGNIFQADCTYSCQSSLALVFSPASQSSLASALCEAVKFRRPSISTSPTSDSDACCISCVTFWHAVELQAQAIAAQEQQLSQRKAALHNEQDQVRQQRALLEDVSSAVEKERLEARDMLKACHFLQLIQLLTYAAGRCCFDVPKQTKQTLSGTLVSNCFTMLCPICGHEPLHSCTLDMTSSACSMRTALTHARCLYTQVYLNQQFRCSLLLTLFHVVCLPQHHTGPFNDTMTMF